MLSLSSVTCCCQILSNLTFFKTHRQKKPSTLISMMSQEKLISCVKICLLISASIVMETSLKLNADAVSDVPLSAMKSVIPPPRKCCCWTSLLVIIVMVSSGIRVNVMSQWGTIIYDVPRPLCARPSYGQRLLASGGEYSDRQQLTLQMCLPYPQTYNITMFGGAAKSWQSNSTARVSISADGYSSSIDFQKQAETF